MQPSGAASCELELPEGCQLVNVAVADLPAMLESLGSQRWRVTLGPRQLAQQIQVVYQGRWTGCSVTGRPADDPPASTGRHPRRADAVDGPARRIPHGSISSPRRIALLSRPSNSSASPAARQLIEHASEALAASDPGIAARWYSAWRRRLAASRRAIDQWSAAHPEVRSRYAAELKDVEARQAELDEKLKSLPQLPPVASEPSSPSDPSGRRIRGRCRGRQRGRRRGDGRRARFRSVSVPTPDLVEQQRGAAAAVLLALAAIAWLLLPHPVLHRWGHLLLARPGRRPRRRLVVLVRPSAAGLAVGLVSLLVGLQRLLSSGLPVPEALAASSSSNPN